MHISFPGFAPALLVLCLLAPGGCGQDSSADTATTGGQAWAKLAAPAEVPEGSSFLWAGDRYLLYGGCAHDYGRSGGCGRSREGAEYDPGTDHWASMPASPVGVRGPFAWTGEEAIFLSGAGPGEPGGIAYDPVSRSWRELPAGPLDEADAAVWTGSEVIAWGGKGRFESALADGAAYDPSTDGWREVAQAPLGLNRLDLVWTGSEVIAFGSELDRGNVADTKVAVGAAYEPATDSWRRISDSDLSPQATASAWLDGEMMAYDYVGDFQLYDPERDSWRRAGRMPIDAGECYPDSVESAGYVVAFYCGQILRFDPGPRTWTRIDGGLTERLHQQTPVWRFSQIATDGAEVLFLAEGLTFSSRGQAQYNFPGSPVSLWSYRPDVGSAEPSPVLRRCEPRNGAGGWGGSVAGIGCRAAGQLILHHFIGDFEAAVIKPYRRLENALERAKPGAFESAGFECEHSSHDEETGWSIHCSRGTERIAFFLTR